MPGKRRRKSKPKPRCFDCNLLFEPSSDRWTTGLCPKCRHQRAVTRRADLGRRLLERAQVTGTEQREGRMFTVLTLPPKRR